MSANMLSKEPKESDFSPKKMLFTAVDYQLMGAAGIFINKPKVELIDGEIYVKNPRNTKENAHIDKASEFFARTSLEEIQVRTRGSIRTDNYSEPNPDIAILKYKENFYSNKQATAKDTYLIIEIVVFTTNDDRTIKLKKYASVGIPEYWIIIPKQKIIEVYRKPDGDTYAEKMTYKKKDEWTFEPFELEVKGSDFLI